MKMRIDERIFTQYPNVLLGVAVLHGIDNKGNVDELNQLLRTSEDISLEKIGSTPVTEHPNIVPWREAYRKFGAKPKEYPSSIENLVRRILKGEQVRHINKLVDIYNVISLKHLVPVGGEDINKLSGDVVLTFAGENETPVVMLGEKDSRPPYPNEVIYKDDVGTICRRWNWKEADRTKLTEDTTNAFIVIEALPPVGKIELLQAVSELIELVKKHCGGQITSGILDKDNPEIQL